MEKTAKELSVTELERLLDAKKSELDNLTKERANLQNELQQVDQRISALAGPKSSAGRRRGGRRSAKRVKNPQSLHQVVVDILTRNKKGLPLAKLTEKVLATGYKSNSVDFKNVLYQCVYGSKAIKRDEDSSNYVLV